MSDSGGYGPTRVAAGIVGYADLTLGERVEAVLEAQIRAGGGRFRGVRHSGNWDADPIIGNGAPGPDVYRRADFRAGLARLAALGLSLDAWVFHTQLADVIDLARAFPGTNIIMGHVGGVLGYGPYAGRRDEVFASWKASVTELAKCPNVTMKLGGMMMRAALYDYKAAERPITSEELAALWRPYMETCIELFGPQRCMFESNFPVEKMGIGWAALWNAFKRIAAGASADEKLALFHDTAPTGLSVRMKRTMSDTTHQERILDQFTRQATPFSTAQHHHRCQCAADDRGGRGAEARRYGARCRLRRRHRGVRIRART